jgi:FKBP-type peptidyl-prolyl cis-trans isomerase (trigger factor)
VAVAYQVETGDEAQVPVEEQGFDAAEISREGARRVYKVRIPSATVKEAAHEQIARLSTTIRLPGFRPGKVPAAELEKRYGAQARQEALNRLAAEASSRVAPKGGVPSAIKLVRGAQSGDLEFELTVTYLPDLPAFDASQLTLESFTATEADLQAAGLDTDSGAAMFRGQLKRQVLDRLHEAYSFPLIPALVEREFTVLWKTAEADLGTRTIEPKVRAALAAEFREIAERRVRLGLVIAEMARRHGIHAPHSAALEDAVIDHLAGQARVSQRRASVDELRQMMEE